MSATFVADGRDAVVLGFNRQQTVVRARLPYLYAGIVGPVDVPASLARRVGAALGAICAQHRLRGLGSLDFIADGESPFVLEVNARPPASLELYPDIGGGGALAAHLRACLDATLPAPPRAPAARLPVHGRSIVYAERALTLSATSAARIAASSGAHDLPRAGDAFPPGAPLCSIAAVGRDERSVTRLLARRRAALLARLEAIA
jgi:predicted ATP-grasp superfamily ATP-dependent carboligase